MRIISWIFSLGLAVCLLAGCAGQPAEITAGIDQSGQSIRMQTGQTLVVSLPSNPSTGYHWEVETIDSAVLKQVGEAEYQSLAAGATPRPGQGGIEIFHFEPVGQGETPLRLVYRRSFEDAEPAQIFFLQVTVE
jgi:inhibitor of cysteine peptidase